MPAPRGTSRVKAEEFHVINNYEIMVFEIIIRCCKNDINCDVNERHYRNHYITPVGITTPRGEATEEHKEGFVVSSFVEHDGAPEEYEEDVPSISS